MNFKTQRIAIVLTAIITMVLLSTPAAATDGSWWDAIKDAGSDLVDTVKEKGPGWVDTAKEKGGSAIAKAKDGVSAASNAISEFNQGQQEQFFDWFDQQTHPNAQSSPPDTATPNPPQPEPPSSTPQAPDASAPVIIDNSTHNDNRTYNYYGKTPDTAQTTSAQASTGKPPIKSQSWLDHCLNLFSRRVAIDIELTPFYLLLCVVGVLIGIAAANWKSRKK